MFKDLDDIDRELKAALGVEPPVGFEARVRERIEADRPVRWRVPVWLAAAAAAALLLTVTGGYLALRPEPLKEIRTAAAPDIPLPKLEAPAARPVARVATPAPRVTRVAPGFSPAPRVTPVAPGLSPAPRVTPVAQGFSPAPRVTSVAEASRPASAEVIVPPGQLQAIERLVRDVNAGRVVVPEAAAPPPPPAELVVPPLEVPTIPVASVEPGGGSQPGAKGLQ